MANISEMWNSFRSNKQSANKRSLSCDLLRTTCDLRPTKMDETNARKSTESFFNDPTCEKGYTSHPKLIRIVRNNPNTALGLEVTPAQETSPLKRRSPNGQTPKEQISGMRVSSVWVGGVANMCGVREDDIVVGVNNTTWNDRHPKKSAQRLKSELFNTKLCSIDLMILSRA